MIPLCGRALCSGGFFSVQRPAHDSSISPTSAWKARPSSLESAPSNASARAMIRRRVSRSCCRNSSQRYRFILPLLYRSSATVSRSAFSSYSASQAGRPSAATARQVRSFTRPVSRSRKSPIFPSFGQGKSPHSPQWSSPFSRTQRWTLQGTV